MTVQELLDQADGLPLVAQGYPIAVALINIVDRLEKATEAFCIAHNLDHTQLGAQNRKPDQS